MTMLITSKMLPASSILEEVPRQAMKELIPINTVPKNAIHLYFVILVALLDFGLCRLELHEDDIENHGDYDTIDGRLSKGQKVHKSHGNCPGDPGHDVPVLDVSLGQFFVMPTLDNVVIGEDDAGQRRNHVAQHIKEGEQEGDFIGLQHGQKGADHQDNGQHLLAAHVECVGQVQRGRIQICGVGGKDVGGHQNDAGQHQTHGEQSGGQVAVVQGDGGDGAADNQKAVAAYQTGDAAEHSLLGGAGIAHDVRNARDCAEYPGSDDEGNTLNNGNGIFGDVIHDHGEVAGYHNGFYRSCNREEDNRGNGHVAQNGDGVKAEQGENAHDKGAEHHADDLSNAAQIKHLGDKMTVGGGLNGVPPDVDDGNEKRGDLGALPTEAVPCQQSEGKAGAAGNDTDQNGQNA